MLTPLKPHWYAKENIDRHALHEVERTFRIYTENKWLKHGDQMALDLFRRASYGVPAYKDFLRRNHVRASTIRTAKDLIKIPSIDKNNYLTKYPLRSLCWQGSIGTAGVAISASSGSSGKPFYWPRSRKIEFDTTVSQGLLLKALGAHAKKTLLVDTFSMGIYVAGTVIYSSALRLATHGMPITLVTPGVDIPEIIRTIIKLSSSFEQTVIAGYPPFVRDVIADGTKAGIKWSHLNVKFIFAAENFSEEFRESLLNDVGSRNSIDGALSIYGSAEASIMGHETPGTVSIRRVAVARPEIAQKLFGRNDFLPTLVHYNPVIRRFEEKDGELLLTCDSGLPLIRYAIHDKGGLLANEKVDSVLNDGGSSRTVSNKWNLPLLFVFGKSTATFSFYGLKVYPDNIKAGLETRSLKKIVSGRFVTMVKNDKKQKQYWELHIELQDSKHPSRTLKKSLREAIVAKLIEKNLEYSKLHLAIGKKSF